ncbi:MAG: phytanoyl-CoA dioxygenase family protein [Byssovorax sp.]
MPAELVCPETSTLDLDAALASFREHGYARLGPALRPEAAMELCARAEQIMLGEVSYPGLFFQHDTATGRYEDLTYKKGYEGPSLNYRKIEKLEKDPLFSAWINNPFFARIARAVIPGPVAIYRAVLFNKAKQGGSFLPFHQDGGSYWGLDRDPVLQIWTALDDVPEDSGCVELIPGSHKGGFATPLGGVIPDEVVRTRDGEPRIFLPAKRGESLLIHTQVWHRSGQNHTDHPRRALTICYMSAETRCMRKKRAPRQFVRVFEER